MTPSVIGLIAREWWEKEVNIYVVYTRVLFSKCASSSNPVNVCCLRPSLCLGLKCGFQKRPWHGSVSRRCSGKATEEDRGFGVIWHTVKDPRNLHSDCVPVGWAELCLSLAMLLLAPIPKLASALLRELEGGPVSEFTVAGCPPSPSPSTYSSVYDMFTHTAEKLRVLPPPPLCFQGLC